MRLISAYTLVFTWVLVLFPGTTACAQPDRPIVEVLKRPAGDFGRLLDLPKSCSAVRDAGPPFSHPPLDPLCDLKKDCLFTLSAQIKALIEYLEAHPLVTAELQRHPVPYFSSFDRLLNDLHRAALASNLRSSTSDSTNGFVQKLMRVSKARSLALIRESRLRERL